MELFFLLKRFFQTIYAKLITVVFTCMSIPVCAVPLQRLYYHNISTLSIIHQDICRAPALFPMLRSHFFLCISFFFPYVSSMAFVFVPTQCTHFALRNGNKSHHIQCACLLSRTHDKKNRVRVCNSHRQL